MSHYKPSSGVVRARNAPSPIFYYDGDTDFVPSEVTLSYLDDIMTMRVALLRSVGENRLRIIRDESRRVLSLVDGTAVMRDQAIDFCTMRMMAAAVTDDANLRDYWINLEMRIFSSRAWAMNSRALVHYIETVQHGLDIKRIEGKDLRRKSAKKLRIKINMFRLYDVKPETRRGKRVMVEADLAKMQNLSDMTFFSMPFEMAGSALARRQGVMHKGDFIMPPKYMRQVLIEAYRKRLNTIADEMSGFVREAMFYVDDRIPRLLASFAKLLRDEPAETKEVIPGVVNQALIDQEQRNLLPLCMFRLYQALRAKSTLKYQGRTQLLLFFKAMGMRLADAKAMWRREFTKKGAMTNAKYTQQYEKDVEGIWQSPKAGCFGCRKIVATPPATGQYNGCPFQSMDDGPLSGLLRHYGLQSKQAIKDIVRLSRGRNYGVACARTLSERSNGASVASCPVIMHPMKYANTASAIRFQNNVAPPIN